MSEPWFLGIKGFMGLGVEAFIAGFLYLTQ